MSQPLIGFGNSGFCLSNILFELRFRLGLFFRLIILLIGFAVFGLRSEYKRAQISKAGYQTFSAVDPRS